MKIDYVPRIGMRLKDLKPGDAFMYTLPPRPNAESGDLDRGPVYIVADWEAWDIYMDDDFKSDNNIWCFNMDTHKVVFLEPSGEVFPVEVEASVTPAKMAIKEA